MTSARTCVAWLSLGDHRCERRAERSPNGPPLHPVPRIQTESRTCGKGRQCAQPWLTADHVELAREAAADLAAPRQTRQSSALEPPTNQPTNQQGPRPHLGTDAAGQQMLRPKPCCCQPLLSQNAPLKQKPTLRSAGKTKPHRYRPPWTSSTAHRKASPGQCTQKSTAASGGAGALLFGASALGDMSLRGRETMRPAVAN